MLWNPAHVLAIPKIRSLPRGIVAIAQAHRLMAVANRTARSASATARFSRRSTGLACGSAKSSAPISLMSISGIACCSSKGRKDRIVPIGAAAITALDRYLTDTPPMLANAGEAALFVTRSGRRLQAPGLRVRVYEAGHRIGVPLTPHALRHAYATHLLRGGADLRHVQALLGNRCLTTTAIYTRVAITDLRSVIQTCHPRDRRRRRCRRRVE